MNFLLLIILVLLSLPSRSDAQNTLKIVQTFDMNIPKDADIGTLKFNTHFITVLRFDEQVIYTLNRRDKGLAPQYISQGRGPGEATMITDIEVIDSSLFINDTSQYKMIQVNLSSKGMNDFLVDHPINTLASTKNTLIGIPLSNNSVSHIEIDCCSKVVQNTFSLLEDVALTMSSTRLLFYHTGYTAYLDHSLYRMSRYYPTLLTYSGNGTVTKKQFDEVGNYKPFQHQSDDGSTTYLPPNEVDLLLQAFTVLSFQEQPLFVFSYDGASKTRTYGKNTLVFMNAELEILFDHTFTQPILSLDAHGEELGILFDDGTVILANIE